MQQANNQLEQQFHQAMLDIYEAAPYHASYFGRMVKELGGKEAAVRLLTTDQPSEGFMKLYRSSHLELSVEYLILKKQWQPLFTPTQLTTARERLRNHGFDPPPEDAT